MANPLYNSLMNMGKRQQSQGPRNMAQPLIQYIQNFKGDPCQALQQKLNSGEITQAQYNQARGVAENIVRRMLSVIPKR